MNKEQYKNKRDKLLNEAQTLIDEGKMEEFEAKKKEVEDLDAKFENEAKAAANERALSGAPFGRNPFFAGGKFDQHVEGVTVEPVSYTHLRAHET